ncbi:hypothetical protein KR067_010049 [Drosophila pandora]|nr:hypothetical protein KR067_010049 [Drosophila pandora]
MAVLSKSFQEWLSGRSCNELLHPHTCRRAAFENLFRFAWSNSKYYLPVVLLHLGKHSLRSGGTNREILSDSLWYYMQLVFGGVVDASLISISICSLRNFLGKFHFYTLLFIPATFGGAFCALFPKRVKHLQHTAIFQALIESLLLRLNPLSKLLASSVSLQTVIFMICSAVILEGKQRKWYNGFWFLTPDAPSDPDVPPQRKSCSHSELDCGLYIVRGIRNYLIIGLALDVFRYLVSSSKLNQWSLSHLNFQSTAWLGCYVGLYRVKFKMAVHCYLQSIPILNESLKHPLAGFLGGLSYLFYPKLTILSYALLEAIRTLSSNNHKSRESKKSRFGWSDLLFPLSLAYLIHNYVMEEQRVSALSGVIIDSTTAN